MAAATKEAFWKEHQDSLIRIRSQLSSDRKKTPPNRKIVVSQAKKRPASNPTHPPLGRYRHTPPLYLHRVSSPVQVGHRTPPLRGSKYEVVPPVKPKPAFVSRTKADYDSWGEESDAEDDHDSDRRLRHYKPKPYPQPSPLMMGAPFAMYYPPPPKGGGRRGRNRKGGREGRGYREMYQDRLVYQSAQQAVPKKSKRHKKGKGAQSMPVFMPMPMVPMMVPIDGKYKYIYGEEDSSEEEQDPLKHMERHPGFGEGIVATLITELMEEELVPDILMDALRDYDRWSYDHPQYLPTLFSCEDLISDGVQELVDDIVREVSSEMVDHYMDQKLLQHDPLEDFLSLLMSDAVDGAVREVVRECVLDMAEDHLVEETVRTIYNDIFKEELQTTVPGVLEDVQFDLIAEDFIETEVVAPEVKEEAAAVSKEILHHYDNKVTKRELKEVTKMANGQLADSLLMEYMLSVIAHQGKIWAQDDYYEQYLDDLVLTVSMEQYYEVQKHRDKTLDNKPLRKLHEKAFMEVALDVSLQQLTASLDEDLADVDEYEQGIMDATPHPIPLTHSS